MANQQKQIEIGNLVVKFGADINLIDLFDEVIKPAMFDGTLRRRYSKTSYLIYEPAIFVVEGELVIAGRLIKDTILEREQLLVDGVLQEMTGRLPSSPSSFFVLLLSNHRLLFVRENRGSPAMTELKSTLAKFIKDKHSKFIRSLRKKIDPDTGVFFEWRKILLIYPSPSVDLRPIASTESVDSFVNKFSKLEVITTHLLETNSEIDNDGLFKAIRKSQRRLKSNKTTLKSENKDVGLDKREAKVQLAALAKQGNHDVRLSGFDQAGEKLEGNNENFKVKVPIDELPDKTHEAALFLVKHFHKLKRSATISVPDPASSVVRRVRSLIEGLLPNASEKTED